MATSSSTASAAAPRRPHSTRRPLIAINGLYHAEDPMLRLRQRYIDYVRAGGGTPLALTPHLPELGPDGQPTPAAAEALEEELDAVLAGVDGLLLTGGDDFHTPALGLGTTHPAAETTHLAKQHYDLALTRAALRRDLPSLGICFGMQCLGLAGGATLHQHLPDAPPSATNPAVSRAVQHADSAIHPVQPQEGTKLANATGVAPFPVVSRHHQALRTVPPPWIIAALDEENLIEAIEHPGLRFAVGVQWHPELGPQLLPDDPSAGALCRAFINAARGTRLTRGV
ncbi:MAG: gamma-glutamyl-gamma-aminobutyrate hydrolase family protein [Planctomycetota bacterium]